MTTEVNNNTTTEAFSVVMLEVLHEYFPGDARILLRSDLRTKEWHMAMVCRSLNFKAFYTLFPSALVTMSKADYTLHQIAHFIAKDFNKAYLSDKTDA